MLIVGKDHTDDVVGVLRTGLIARVEPLKRSYGTRADWQNAQCETSAATKTAASLVRAGCALSPK
jgi:hypothetical protein